MNDYDHIEPTLNDILRAINPSNEDCFARLHLIDEVQSVVGSIESLSGASVEPFGSFVSNLFTKWGDVDISIELLNGSHVSSPGNKHKQRLLGDVLNALRKKGGFRKLQFIPKARVPIVKFVGRFNISCDISVNNLIGQMKSKILLWISTGIDPRFRDLILLVKEWAKAHHINDSKSGTLNSYCLSMLVIFHLQTSVPAILPPLKEIYPGNVIDNLTGVRTVVENNIEDICALNIKRIKSDKSRPVNLSSVSDLFLSFLGKLYGICLRASAQGINPFMGREEYIDTNMRWRPKTYALFVEDPFEQPVNIARAVSSKQLKKIAEAIQVTFQTLYSPYPNQASLVSVLVGPHLSWLGTRTSVSTSTTRQSSSGTPVSRNGFKTHPEIKQPPLQTQPKPHNQVMHKRQIGETNGSKHASTSQQQQQGETNGSKHASTRQKHQQIESNGPKHASRSQKQQQGETNDAMHASTGQKQQQIESNASKHASTSQKLQQGIESNGSKHASSSQKQQQGETNGAKHASTRQKQQQIESNGSKHASSSQKQQQGETNGAKHASRRQKQQQIESNASKHASTSQKQQQGDTNGAKHVSRRQKQQQIESNASKHASTSQKQQQGETNGAKHASTKQKQKQIESNGSKNASTSQKQR